MTQSSAPDPPDARLEALRKMVDSRPGDSRARFGLALEYERTEDWEAAVRELKAYLEIADDEGNAHGRLARALVRLGDEEAARLAYGEGIAAANRHGHPTMAMELEEELEDLTA